MLCLLREIDEMERICNSSFELAPHQTFVRNFLSFLTPYNSLLLYHGLGSGKTATAINILNVMLSADSGTNIIIMINALCFEIEKGSPQDVSASLFIRKKDKP